MDFTKGLPCPCCNKTARFQGGSIGGGPTTTNIKCDCGFSAWVVVTNDEFEYHLSTVPKDKKKANPYIVRETDKKSLIIQKHYFKEALEACENNHAVSDALRKAVSYIDDILKEKP